MQRNQIIGISMLVVLIGVGYYLVYVKPATSNVPESASSTPSSVTTESDFSGGTLGITATGDGYTVKEIPIGNKALKVPDYNAPLVFSVSANLSEEQKSALQSQASDLRAQLMKNPSSYVAWLALGRTFKTAGDYARAADIWKYLSLSWPTDAIALGNLGDLYMNFIKDYPKADASYLGAIRNDPHQTNAYRNLFFLYSSLYTTNASAAEDILKKGIQNNPDAIDFYVLLARYYRDTGRIEEARAEYDVAISQAKKLSDRDYSILVADLLSEQSAL